VSTLKGTIQTVNEKPLADVEVAIVSMPAVGVAAVRAATIILRTDEAGVFGSEEVPAGEHVVLIFEPGFVSERRDVTLDENEEVDLGVITLNEIGAPAPVESPLPGESPVGSPVDVIDIVDVPLPDLIMTAPYDLEAEVSLEEADQAIQLFRVVTLMLAGQGTYNLDNSEKTDILGILTLYYGLQDKSLSNRLVLQQPSALWSEIGGRLKTLADDLLALQGDVSFLRSEARRQFFLGRSNGAVGNAQFPTLFTRYVALGSDPLLALNLEIEEGREFADRAQIEEAYDLLRSLKSTILQTVRSLSKYGTAGTSRVNEDWSQFEAEALKVLYRVAQARVSDDLDNLTTWATLGELVPEESRANIIPYAALARHGSRLLVIAMEIYERSKGSLDDYDSTHLRELFQPNIAGVENYTARIRREAGLINQHPLSQWGA
jgi:hypothetical protein